MNSDVCVSPPSARRSAAIQGFLASLPRLLRVFQATHLPFTEHPTAHCLGRVGEGRVTRSLKSGCSHSPTGLLYRPPEPWALGQHTLQSAPGAVDRRWLMQALETTPVLSQRAVRPSSWLLPPGTWRPTPTAVHRGGCARSALPSTLCLTPSSSQLPRDRCPSHCLRSLVALC